eukprot:8389022-Lingulodinium_polyedra.AAC.1
MVQLVQTVSQFVTVEESVSVVWLTRLQFIARAVHGRFGRKCCGRKVASRPFYDTRVMKRGRG